MRAPWEETPSASWPRLLGAPCRCVRLAASEGGRQGGKESGRRVRETGTQDCVNEVCNCRPSLLPLPLVPRARCGAPHSEKHPTLALGHTSWLSPHAPARTAGDRGKLGVFKTGGEALNAAVELLTSSASSVFSFP